MTTTQPTTASQRPPAGLLEALAAEVVAGHSDSFEVRSPIDGSIIARIPLSRPDDVTIAFRHARAAQERWARIPVRERAAVLLRFHDLVLANRDEGLDVVQWETAKARKDALEELLDVCAQARYYARDAPRLLRTRRVRSAFPGLISTTVRHLPKGVVGIIAPWNYPLTLAVSDAIPALLAGNCVVIKPDTQTTLTALWALHLLHAAGLPRGVLNVVAGEGEDLGPALVEHSDYVMFTGSTRVGRIIAEQCGRRLIGCSLELGGKNAMVVRADIDVDRAAETAVRACFANAGQLCISMERLYIHTAVWDRFVSRFVERVRNLRVGAVVGWGSDIGSLISAGQLATVTAHVDDAVAKGATVLAGGRARPDLGPFVFEPTVLTGVTPEMVACAHETFGPVVSLYRVTDDAEAVARANDTDYGLNAAVLTGDLAAGMRIAEQLRAGTVNVNEGYAPAWSATRAPMGGMKDSGIGRRHGDEGLLKYTESQTIGVMRTMGFGPPFGWSDQRWGDTLTRTVRAMKSLGLK